MTKIDCEETLAGLEYEDYLEALATYPEEIRLFRKNSYGDEIKKFDGIFNYGVDDSYDDSYDGCVDEVVYVRKDVVKEKLL